MLHSGGTFGEGDSIREHPALVRAIVAQQRTARSTDVDTSEFQSVLRLRGWHPATRLTEGTLSDLQQPTLFLWGENDPLGGPEDVREGIEMLPDATLQAIEDVGHVP